jgi:hypothetical protein
MKKPRFPTKDGIYWTPEPLLWQQMCRVYGEDLLTQEIPKMDRWLCDHPSKWPTVRGAHRFMKTWLGKSHPKAPTIAKNRPTDAWMVGSGPEMPKDEANALRAKLGLSGRIM